jgi:hypothetical protein
VTALTWIRARAHRYLGPSAPVQMRVTEFDSPRETYLAIAELCRRSETTSPSASRDLSTYELRVFSQNGEDGVLDEILRRVGTRTRTFVEFGAGSGAEALCVYLADVAGWNGLFIEANPPEFAVLSAKYAMSTRVAAHPAMITPDNVEQTFARFDVPEEFDVLSIDIDSHEYWVWRAITRYRPRVVIS